MEVELSGHAVPFVFEMNHAGLSKMDPAWLARLSNRSPTCSSMRRPLPSTFVEVRARLRQERAPRAHQARARHDAALAIDYSFEVPRAVRGSRAVSTQDPGGGRRPLHLRALDLRGNLDEIIRRLEAVPEGEVHAALCLRTRPRDRQPKRIREGRPEKGACAARGSGRPDRRPLGDALLPSLPQPEARPEARGPSSASRPARA